MSKERPSSVSVLKTIILSLFLLSPFFITFFITFILLFFDNFQFEKNYSSHTFVESVFPV